MHSLMLLFVSLFAVLQAVAGTRLFHGRSKTQTQVLQAVAGTRLLRTGTKTQTQVSMNPAEVETAFSAPAPYGVAGHTIGNEIVEMLKEIDKDGPDAWVAATKIEKKPYLNENNRLPYYLNKQGNIKINYNEYDLRVDKDYSNPGRRGAHRLFYAINGPDAGTWYYNNGVHDGDGPASVTLIRKADEKDEQSWKPVVAAAQYTAKAGDFPALGSGSGSSTVKAPSGEEKTG